MNSYNIMTSSDENLLHQVEILLYSIGVNLTEDEVDFYFFHRGIADDKMRGMCSVAEHFTNIRLHFIIVEDVENYDYMASHGGGWAGEAYFSLMAHTYLPQDADRVMYVDAGDVIFTGDISKFYCEDFEGKSILASNIRTYVEDKPIMYDFDDLSDPASILGMLDSTFNSGSYLINIDKLRSEGRSMEDYLEVVQLCEELRGKDETQIYFGDQGFLSFCFVGDIKYWGYPENPNLITTKYNFTMGWYRLFEGEPPFKPSVVHFVGGVKPWRIIYAKQLRRIICEPDRNKQDLLLGQEQWYCLWHEYAMAVEKILESKEYI